MDDARPNIVLFLTDDHGGWAMRCAGNRELRTPNLDRLAATGVRFPDATTPSPVSSPARACLMTGRTPSQVGIHDWLGGDCGEARDWLAGEATLPELLRGAGYRAALAGKWHLGSPVTPDKFDRAYVAPQQPHNGLIRGTLDGRPVEADGNNTTVTTDHALALLADRTGDQPFFLNVGHVATHSPYDEARHDSAVVATYRDATLADLPDDPPHPWVKNEGTGGPHVVPDGEAAAAMRRGYYAAVTETDREVGRVLDELDRQGLAENTVVLYTADHGCALGHRGFWGKGNSTRPLNMHGVSLHVPLIARHLGRDGWRGGVVRDTPVDHYDTFMTLLDVAGVRPDLARAYPGFSYADPAWRRCSPRFGEYGDLRSIDDGSHRLTFRYPAGPHDLFDLAVDLEERHNLADDPRHAGLLDELAAQLAAWYAKHEDPAKSGLRVRDLPRHNPSNEAWRDGRREARGLQLGRADRPQWGATASPAGEAVRPDAGHGFPCG